MAVTSVEFSVRATCSSSWRRSAISTSSSRRHFSIWPFVGASRNVAISAKEMPARRSKPMRLAIGIWEGE